MHASRSALGSSPHTRGARHFGVRDRCRAGIIPAYAGSTGHRARAPCTGGDHPRIRGEHHYSIENIDIVPGSSPHTRGALTIGIDELEALGIIPAYAGSTRRQVVARDVLRDHPRIRGEHACLRQSVMGRPGSSPHTRGAREHDRGAAPGVGIIPAYAGSTPVAFNGQDRRRDHPRIRGEHRTTFTVSTKPMGSSPHTRGALSTHIRARPARGIIPAYAGSTALKSATEAGSWDHPRIRGEHVETS